MPKKPLPASSTSWLLLFLGATTCPVQLEAQPIQGKVSFYADFFHGRRTANGEVFNQHKMTAAHRTLPFGTVLRITNPKNSQSVVVRINDRGPYVKGRVLDLSKAAAKHLGFINQGVAMLDIEAVDRDSYLEQYFDEVLPNEEKVIVQNERNSPSSTESYQIIPTENISYNSSPTPSSDVSNLYEPIRTEQLLASTTRDIPMFTPIMGVSLESQDLPSDLKYTPDGPFSTGTAFVYPDWEEGKEMLNGEIYNSGQFTCAHNKYPLGRYLKVTRKDDPNLSVIVKVTDSKPHLQEYDIQLSWAAHSNLDLFNVADKEVVIEEIVVTDLDAIPDPSSAASKTVEIDFLGMGLNGSSENTTVSNGIAPANSIIAAAKTQGLGLFQLNVTRLTQSGYGVQIAVANSYQEVLGISERMGSMNIHNTLIHSDIINGSPVMRFIVGPFSEKSEADAFKTKLAEMSVEGMVMSLEPLQ